jgi:hypothetical protein
MTRKVLAILAALFFVSAVVFASDCSKISKESQNSENWKLVKHFLEEYYQSKTIIIRQINKKDTWHIVEFESTDFEPVISVLEGSPSGFILKSDWGGMPVEGDSIKDYLAENTKGVPPDLLGCFSPKGPPFARIKHL